MDYTKGRWEVETGALTKLTYIIANGFHIATVLPVESEEEEEANAHLIAAAPDLYEALRSLASVCRDISYTHSELIRARQALAKAEAEV